MIEPRAGSKTAGLPPGRTTKEKGLIADIVAGLSISEVVGFTTALVDEGGADVGAAEPESAAAVLQTFVDQVGAVLGLLGGRQTNSGNAITLLPYRQPTYEVVSSASKPIDANPIESE